MTNVSILILAAGEGTRMKSSLPKVLHEAAGKPLVSHVLDAAAVLKGATGLVLGRGADDVKERLSGRHGLGFFLQKERLGSGHAVKPAAAWLKKRGGDAVILCGDAPLVRPDTLRALLALHKKEGNAATLLTARVPDPSGYGRIVRAAGRPSAIIEHKDASPAQLSIKEINSGTYAFRTADLLWALAKVRPDNAKGEYYITDVVSLLVRAGRPVGALCVEGEEECLGVNTRAELARAEKVLRRRQAERLMAAGVTIVDPDATYVDAGVAVGPDTVLWPQTYLLGDTRVGAGCRVGPFAVLEDCRVADGASVGPFARLRPGARLGERVRVGNFVEVKKSSLAAGVKVNHLAYVGDATIGPDVNVGAGVITCNYDGVNKHPTRIGAGAFIGSNVNLVAPVSVGKGAVVGAGSTITRNVPADALALERAQQISKPGWAARRRKTLRAERKNHG